MTAKEHKNYLDRITLDRHAVIEASAGTGKTYTIEQLFVKLMCEKGVDFDRILVLTFTEKATGELRERIRSNIAKELKASEADPKAAEKLRFAYDNFDDAAIFTIHGFCSRILRQHAFENGELFRVSLEDDAPLYERMLAEIMRKGWQKLFGPALPALLELSGFPRLKSGHSAWEDDVIKIARSCRPEHGDSIHPSPLVNLREEILKRVEHAQKLLGAAAKLVGDIDTGDLEKSDLYVEYSKLCTRKDYLYSRLREMILPLLKIIAGYQAEGRIDITACLGLIRYVNKKKNGFNVLLANCDKGSVKAMSSLEALVKQLEGLHALLSDELINRQLDVVTIIELRRAVERHKREKAFICYEDMLLALDRALSAPAGRAGLLLDALRSRYSYGLIDEFQDTDPVQWSIFRKIFLDEPSGDATGRRLFLIGDPKQAIYAFRGADVYTYLDATLDVGKRADAAVYPLATNWRSIPPLIDAFNALFTKGKWFTCDDIKYLEVKDPDEGADKAEKRNVRVYEDRTGRSALSIVDLGVFDAPGDSRRAMADFIASEIKLLTDGSDGPALVFGTRGERRILRESDIAVLVKDRSEAKFIESSLDRFHIPHSFYKKQGLYQSEEADHLAYLLGAVNDPTDSQRFKKALLTPFFRIEPQELTQYEDLASSHPLKQRFEDWYDLAGRRKWPRLFQSVIDDTGVSYREITDPDGERRITNYRHILENLEREASQYNLDFNGIIERLNAYRLQTETGGEDFDLHRLETEKPKVQILTIHAAKGLEYPVVFIGGGFTSRKPTESYYKYHDSGRRIVYNLAKDASAELSYKNELRHEEERLFYVALTRAKVKLYVPKFQLISDRNKHHAGPLLHIVSSAISEAFGGHKDDMSVGTIRFNEKGGEARKKGTGAPEPFIDKPEKALPLKGQGARPELPSPLFPDASFSFKERKLEIDSFTSLKERAEAPLVTMESAYEEPGNGLASGKDDDDASKAPVLESIPAAAPKEKMLPPSKDTGSMLHEIFEAIDFIKAGMMPSSEALLGDPDIKKLIDIKLARYGLIGGHVYKKKEADDDFYRKETARIIWQTLITPFAPGGFSLAGIGKDEKRHELEFYYPLPMAQELKIPGVKASREGFLMGYIDLVFRHDGRYYILDWKSNRLEEGYGADAVKKSMDEAGYHLQYKLYTIAVLRWLKAHIKDFDYEKHFGGVYYVYLRGRDGKDAGKGLFFHRPEGEDEVKGYERMLFEMVNQ